MKFTYNGMEIECTVEEFMKITGSGGEAKDPVEVIGKLTDPISLSIDPVDLDKEVIDKLIFGEEDDNNCTESEPAYPLCPNYSEYGCAYQNGILDKWKEYNDLVDEFKKDPRYLEKEETWPYDEAKCDFGTIMEAGIQFAAVDMIIQRTDDPGYEPGAVVVICPEIDGAYQVYDDAGYVMPVDDLVGFVRKAYHADISIYSPLEVVDNDFAQEIEDACMIIAAEETERLLKQR